MADGRTEKNVRDNPPDTVITNDEYLKYIELYDDITENGIGIQYSHRHSLAELAVQLVEMKALRIDLNNTGETLEVQGDRNVVTKRNPSRDALDKLRTSTARLFREFRMTPNSVTKTGVTIPNKDKTGDGWDDI